MGSGVHSSANSPAWIFFSHSYICSFNLNLQIDSACERAHSSYYNIIANAERTSGLHVIACKRIYFLKKTTHEFKKTGNYKQYIFMDLISWEKDGGKQMNKLLMLLECVLVFPTEAAHTHTVTPRPGDTSSGCNHSCSEKRALMKIKLFRNGPSTNWSR